MNYNAVRTLLLNRDAMTGVVLPGDELVPGDYKVVALPTYLTTVRAILFGSSPDRLMMGYRLRQFMAVLHASPLVDHVLALNSKITYRLDARDLVQETVFTPMVTRLTGTNSDLLTVLGRPAAPDATGRTTMTFLVTLPDSNTVATERTTPPIQKTLSDSIPGQGGLSQAIVLAGTGYSFRINTTSPGASWLVEIKNRPQYDLGQLVAAVACCGEPTLDALFGRTRVEPYLTYRNLWYDQRETPLRLAALLMTVALRTAEQGAHGG